MTFDRIDMQRIATAAAGALVLSATCVVTAITPVRAAEITAPRTVTAWQAEVEQQIDAHLRLPASFRDSDKPAAATVSVHFDTQGGFDGARIVRSTGVAALDSEALRTARSIHYPVLPAGLRGSEHDIAMQLYFGEATPAATQARREAVSAMAADAETHHTQTASLPQG